MSANIRELYTGLSMHTQRGIGVLPADGDFMWIARVNSAPATVNYNTESDAADFGKGHEWGKVITPMGVDVSVDLEKYLTTEMAAFLIMFALGEGAVSTPVPGVYGYAANPLNATTEGIELPYTTFIEGIRANTGAPILDRALIGCVVNAWTLDFTAGPGRVANRLTMQLAGSGHTLVPSGVVYGTEPFKEHPVRLSTVTLGTTDYVASKKLISLSVSYSNNLRLDQGYVVNGPYEGSFNGSPGWQVRRRLELGDRTIGVQMVVRLEADSTELSDLLNAKIQRLSLAAYGGYVLDSPAPDYYHHTVTLVFPNLETTAVVVSDDSGIVTVAVTLTPLQLGSDPVVTMTSTLGRGDIGTPSAVRPGLYDLDLYGAVNFGS